MNNEQYLLTCIMEEAAEVAKAASKAIRFGINEVYPETKETNIDRLARELNDLDAVVSMFIGELGDDGKDFMRKSVNPGHIKQKKDKMIQYMEYSQRLGILQGGLHRNNS